MKAITIAGRITKDSEIKTGGVDQNQFVTFSVAVDDGYGAVGVQPYLNKGTSLTVNGEFTQREYNNKTYLGVRVNDLTLQGGKVAPSASVTPANSLPVDMDDEIPF